MIKFKGVCSYPADDNQVRVRWREEGESRSRLVPCLAEDKFIMDLAGRLNLKQRSKMGDPGAPRRMEILKVLDEYVEDIRIRGKPKSMRVITIIETAAITIFEIADAWRLFPEAVSRHNWGISGTGNGKCISREHRQHP